MATVHSDRLRFAVVARRRFAAQVGYSSSPFRGRKRIIDFVLRYVGSARVAALPFPIHWKGFLLCVSLAISAGAGGWLRDSELASRWAFLSLLPLLLAIRNYRPRGAAACGALWGLSHLIGAVAGVSDHRLPAMAMVSMAVIPTLYACLGAWSVRRTGFHPLVLAVAWMLAEYIASIPEGGRSLLLPTTPVAGTISDWIAHHLGYILLAFLWALMNSLVVSAVAILIEAMTRTERQPGGHPAALVALPIVIGFKRWFSDASRARAPPPRTAIYVIIVPFGW